MVHGDRLTVRRPGADVLVDITSIIGAEDFIVSQNRGARPEDPFARQCFVELVQSLIFMPKVYVPHPTLADPRTEDFGRQPWLLQSLMRAELVHPLQLTEQQWSAAQSLESVMLHDLKSPQGTRSLLQFIDQALICDGSQLAHSNSLSTRIRGWSKFQARAVRIPGNHVERIDTQDGIEDDDYGIWARAAALTLEGSLERIAPVSEQKYVMANLARGLKYKVRADVARICYQSHPMRRDFSITFQLNQEGTEDALILDLIKAVRGIHQSLAEAAGKPHSNRMRLLELELPLLGGRLWRSAEAGRYGDRAWLDLLVGRITAYRHDAVDLRDAVERCVTDEDYLRLSRDLDEVKQQLLERLGLQRVEPSPLERELVDGVASVAQATVGVPKVSGLWFGTRTLGRKVKQFKMDGQPYQQFLYREFVRAWKSAGK